MSKQTDTPASQPGKKPAAPQTAPPVEKKLKNVRYRQTMPEFPEPPRDTEAARRKIVIYGTLVTFALVFALVALAVLQVAVLEPRRAVANVGGEDVTVSALQSQMRLNLASSSSQYNQLLNQIAQLQSGSETDQQTASFLAQIYQQQAQQVAARISVDGVSQAALDTLINDLLIRQEARKRGLSVTAQQAQQELERDFGYFTVPLTPFPTPTPAPVTPGATPGPTAEPRLQPTSVPEAQYRQQLDSAVQFFTRVGLGEEGLRKSYELRLLETALREELGKGVPTTAPHYAFDYVRFNNEEDAKKAVERLGARSITFDALISETNEITQPTVIGSGGALDWTSKSSVTDQFGDEIVTALDAAALNAPTGVVTSTFGGFHVFLVKGRETRLLSESELTQERQKPYDAWLAAAQEDPALVKRLETPSKFLPNDLRQAIVAFEQQR